MVRWSAAAVFVLAMSASSAPARAACQVMKLVEIPVTMVGLRPIVTARINGREARLILDSGAFFSTIARANALEYGLPIRPVAMGARLRGIGGDTSLAATTVTGFGLGGQVIPRVDFAVGGSDTGFAGLLGQNILGLADVEYDLPHGAVRLMRGQDCKNAAMAYWGGAKPVTLVPIEPMNGVQRHTIGTIAINGVRIKAVFDTGAGGSLLSLAAARRIGITPDSPGVVPSGFAVGVGQGRVRAWRARFDAIDIGGEAIRGPLIQIADQPLDGADMLIGIDFFLTHRIYVDNASHRMWITYEGGPLFGLNPKGAVDGSGAALDLADKAAEPADAAGYSRRGAVLAAARRFDAAIADFDKAAQMAPGEAQYVLQRAAAHLANRQPLLAATDLDIAIGLAPANAEARLLRAQLRLAAHYLAAALADLEAADRALAPSADARLRLAGLYEAADAYDAALAGYDQWLRSHPEDHDRAVAFAGRCSTRALLGRELDKALADCDAALRLRPGEAAYLDGRALVRFRRGELARSLADYDAAVAAQPRNAWSLYLRNLAERRAGKTAQADADRAAALAIDPQVEEHARRYQLE